MSNKLKFKKGDLITVAQGEYSDFKIRGLFRVNFDFDAKEMLKHWAKSTGRHMRSDVQVQYDFENNKIEFIEMLEKDGLISELDYKQLHICEGGNNNETELSVS